MLGYYSGELSMIIVIHTENQFLEHSGSNKITHTVILENVEYGVSGILSQIIIKMS
jgi:hypothetical protein